MTLIKSISGIRGTIGGKYRSNLTAQDIVECTAAYGSWILKQNGSKKIVIGRDGRISGPLLNALISNTLISLGIDVVDLGLSTTPTVEVAVPIEDAQGGIIITASHNPKEWNALKFLNHKGEFISGADGNAILQMIEEADIDYATVDQLGKIMHNDTYINKHIDLILQLEDVNVEQIRNSKFHVVVDCINSTGAISIPPLLDALGCTYELLNEQVNGEFAHNPEPLPKHLELTCNRVKNSEADLGIVVDPDVDRLAFINEDGSWFGEEYTLVAIADYILKRRPGNTVSNLSSTRALADVSKANGGNYHAAAVGEVNVVHKMKEVNAVIGGEGNGGIIFPDLHYGRDALVGIALMLSYLAKEGLSLKSLRAKYPNYEMVKDKISLDPNLDLAGLLKKLEIHFQNEMTNTIDGLKIDYSDSWVHMRKSNTEPIIRIYSEAPSEEAAKDLVSNIKQLIVDLT
ncbi:MAG: phosphoglucosamine mutase [Bacteroidota bacterium]